MRKQENWPDKKSNNLIPSMPTLCQYQGPHPWWIYHITHHNTLFQGQPTPPAEWQIMRQVVVGRRGLLFRRCSRVAQAFSMMLWSGLFGGQSITEMFLSASHFFVSRAVCLGSLSCWKRTSLTWEIIVLESTKKSFIKYPAVLDSIHGAFHQNQPSKAQTRHASPDHHPPPPMLQPGGSTLCTSSASPGPPTTPLHSIWPKEVEFGLIWVEHGIPFFCSPFCMRLCPCPSLSNWAS